MSWAMLGAIGKMMTAVGVLGFLVLAIIVLRIRRKG